MFFSLQNQECFVFEKMCSTVFLFLWINYVSDFVDKYVSRFFLVFLVFYFVLKRFRAGSTQLCEIRRFRTSVTPYPNFSDITSCDTWFWIFWFLQISKISDITWNFRHHLMWKNMFENVSEMLRLFLFFLPPIDAARRVTSIYTTFEGGWRFFCAEGAEECFVAPNLRSSTNLSHLIN